MSLFGSSFSTTAPRFILDCRHHIRRGADGAGCRNACAVTPMRATPQPHAPPPIAEGDHPDALARAAFRHTSCVSAVAAALRMERRAPGETLAVRAISKLLSLGGAPQAGPPRER